MRAMNVKTFHYYIFIRVNYSFKDYAAGMHQIKNAISVTFAFIFNFINTKTECKICLKYFNTIAGVRKYD